MKKHYYAIFRRKSFGYFTPSIRRSKMKNKTKKIINLHLALACAFVGLVISLAVLLVKSELRKETMETTTPTDTTETWQDTTGVER